MPNQFGPYKWTPEDVVKEIVKGRQTTGSFIDSMPLYEQQFDWEEIRRMLIERLLKKKGYQDQDTLWSEKG